MRDRASGGLSTCLQLKWCGDGGESGCVMLEVCVNETVTYRAHLIVEHERFTCQPLLPTSISGPFDNMLPRLVINVAECDSALSSYRSYCETARARAGAAKAQACLPCGCSIAMAAPLAPYELSSNSYSTSALCTCLSRVRDGDSIAQERRLATSCSDPASTS